MPPRSRICKFRPCHLIADTLDGAAHSNYAERDVTKALGAFLPLRVGGVSGANGPSPTGVGEGGRQAG